VFAGAQVRIGAGGSDLALAGETSSIFGLVALIRHRGWSGLVPVFSCRDCLQLFKRQPNIARRAIMLRVSHIFPLDRITVF
jgi:hypothetical protein